MEESLADLLTTIRKTFDVSFEPLTLDDKTLEVLTIHNMAAHLDGLLARKAVKNPLKDLPLWAKIWPGAFVLGRLLRKYEPQGKTLLELGGGCGILSLVAERYGFASIITSDINEDALRFAKANVLQNNLAERISVRFLDVSDTETNRSLPQFDRIAASEILYLEELHRPLIKFLLRHLAPDGIALFCTDHARRMPRFAKRARSSFQVQEGHIGVKSKDEEGKEERRIYDILLLSHL